MNWQQAYNAYGDLTNLSNRAQRISDDLQLAEQDDDTAALIKHMKSIIILINRAAEHAELAAAARDDGSDDDDADDELDYSDYDDGGYEPPEAYGNR